MMRIQKGSHAFRRQFDLGGIIRLGGERAKGEWNTELSFFRLTDAPALTAHYGEKPTMLHVMLPDEDPEVVFEDAYELWQGSKKEGVKGTLTCRGDGMYCQRIINPDDPWQREDLPCPTPPHCPLAMEKTPPKQANATGNPGAACGAVGRLRIIAYRVNVMEVYEIRTGSINAFQGLRNTLENLKQHPMFGGRLTGIPFILERKPKQNRFGGTNYPVRLRVATWSEMQQELQYLGNVMQKVQAVIAGTQMPSPTPGGRRLAAPGEADSCPEDLVGRKQLAMTQETPQVPQQPAQPPQAPPQQPAPRQTLEQPPRPQYTPPTEDVMTDEEHRVMMERLGDADEPAPQMPPDPTPRKGLLG